MRGPSIATLVVFVVLVFVLILLPGGCKQQIQANFLQFVSPILKTSSSVQRGLGGVSGGLKKLDELEKENRRLWQENEQLRTTNNLLKTLETEVNRLNKALGFRERSPFRLIPARVIARDNASWWSTCSIDRGSEDGLAVDMAVVTEAGLVGKVATVAKNISNVVLVTDESLRVSVSIEGTNEQGIISGTRASSNFAPDLRIRFLTKTAEIKPGMRVTTSGTGGVFPSGVIVGTVKQFTVKELEGIALVQPAVELSKVQDVFVISGIK
jgi:rod shape-determining protein MreC